MAASTSSFTTKLSVPIRHLLLRQSAVTLSGKLAADRALPVFAPYQKPALSETGIGADNMMFFKRVDSPVTRTASELVMKSSDDDDEDEDEITDVDDTDFDDDSDDFDGVEDSEDAGDSEDVGDSEDY